MKKTLFLTLFFTGILLAPGLLVAQDYSKDYNTERGVAIEGYDPVAYFVDGRPRKGTRKYALRNNGVVYFFASEKNMKLFIKNPEKYKPQFGGWCAYAMAHDEKVKMDPATYKITNGKLYLFFHEWYKNTLPPWNKEEKKLSNEAKKYWKIKHKEAK